MATAKQKEVTTHRVASIQFGMYTDEEVGVPAAASAWQQWRAVTGAIPASAVVQLDSLGIAHDRSHTVVFVSTQGACDHEQG